MIYVYESDNKKKAMEKSASQGYIQHVMVEWKGLLRQRCSFYMYSVCAMFTCACACTCNMHTTILRGVQARGEMNHESLSILSGWLELHISQASQIAEMKLSFSF